LKTYGLDSFLNENCFAFLYVLKILLLQYRKYLNFKYIFTFSAINYLQSGISFVVSILLARQLGKEDFGYFSYGLVFANTISTVMQFGTERTLVRDLVQLGKPDVVMWSAAWIWFVFGSLISIATAVWSFVFSSMDYKAALIVAYCSFLGFARGMAPIPWFDFKGKANCQSLILLFERILFFITAAILIFFLKNEKTVILISFIQLITRLLALAVEWKFVLRTSLHFFKPQYITTRKIIGENIWVWLAGLGNLLMTQANQVILQNKFGPKELANYGLALQVITIVRLLQIQLQRLTAPTIAEVTNGKQNSANSLKALCQFSILSLTLTLFIIIPLFFLSPYLIEKFVGKEYLYSIPVLNVLYLWSLFYGVATIVSQFLLGFHLHRFAFISTGIFGLLSLLLAKVFVDKYQSTGAALSLLISHFCSVLFLLFILLKKMKETNTTVALTVD